MIVAWSRDCETGVAVYQMPCPWCDGPADHAPDAECDGGADYENHLIRDMRDMEMQ